MDNLEDFLAPTGESEAAPVEAEVTTEVEQPQEEQPEAEQTDKPERLRGPDGKFAKKEEPVMVPLQALHETRDELKALKRELEAARQPQAQPQAPQVPDIFENPEGYAAHLQNQIAQTTLNDRLNLSEELVRQSAGEETVNAAQEWGKQLLASNPMFAQAFYSQRNPYGFLVKEYQRHSAVSQIADDPNEIKAYLAWKQSQGQVQPVEQTNQQSPAPPRSIASATSAGGVSHTAMGPGVAFGNFIK